MQAMEGDQHDALQSSANNPVEPFPSHRPLTPGLLIWRLVNGIYTEVYYGATADGQPGEKWTKLPEKIQALGLHLDISDENTLMNQ